MINITILKCAGDCTVMYIFGLYMIIFYVAIKLRLLLLSPQLGVHLEFIALKQTTVRVCLLSDCLINIVYLKQ